MAKSSVQTSKGTKKNMLKGQGGYFGPNILLRNFRNLPAHQQYHFLHRNFYCTCALSLLCPLQYLLSCLKIKQESIKGKKDEPAKRKNRNKNGAKNDPHVTEMLLQEH